MFARYYKKLDKIRLNMSKRDLGATIVALRTAQRLSRAALARQAKLSSSESLRRIEQGEMEMSVVDHIIHLALALKVEPLELFRQLLLDDHDDNAPQPQPNTIIPTATAQPQHLLPHYLALPAGLTDQDRAVLAHLAAHLVMAHRIPTETENEETTLHPLRSKNVEEALQEAAEADARLIGSDEQVDINKGYTPLPTNPKPD